MKKTFYCYNRSNHKLTNHKITNPNTKLVRNQFGTPESEYADDNMSEEFVFKQGVFETKTKEEVEFMQHLVENKPYKLKNGRMFEPWVSAVYFKGEKLDEQVKQVQVEKIVQKLVLDEESAKVMSVDGLKNFFVKVGLEVPEEQKTKAELVEILKQNDYII